jgi:hypothetical protein
MVAAFLVKAEEAASREEDGHVLMECGGGVAEEGVTWWG